MMAMEYMDQPAASELRFSDCHTHTFVLTVGEVRSTSLLVALI
jgi:hypothetical protein